MDHCILREIENKTKIRKQKINLVMNHTITEGHLIQKQNKVRMTPWFSGRYGPTWSERQVWKPDPHLRKTIVPPPVYLPSRVPLDPSSGKVPTKIETYQDLPVANCRPRHRNRTCNHNGSTYTTTRLYVLVAVCPDPSFLYHHNLPLMSETPRYLL